jgi:hypothetical protein
VGAFGVNYFVQHSLENRPLAFFVAVLDVGKGDAMSWMLSLGTNGNEETDR